MPLVVQWLSDPLTNISSEAGQGGASPFLVPVLHHALMLGPVLARSMGRSWRLGAVGTLPSSTSSTRLTEVATEGGH